jgi:regulator of replication initiation timing
MSSNETHTEAGTKSLLKTATSASSYLHLSKLLTKATLAKEFFEEAKTAFAQFLKDNPEAVDEAELVDAISSIFSKGLSEEGSTRLNIANTKEATPVGQIEIALSSPDENIDSAYYSRQKLTPNRLLNVIAPYIKAIGETQYVIDEIVGRNFSGINIRAISHNSPVSVNLDGAAAAVRLIVDVVVPWRREHAKRISQLVEREKQVEIASKKAEITEHKARVAKERAETDKIDAEVATQWAETEKLRLENEKLRLELQKAKIELALSLLDRVAPSLPETERLNYLVNLLPTIDVLIFSELEITNTRT